MISYRFGITITAVLAMAGTVISVHNRPSGNCEPAESDLTVTQDVQSCLEGFGIQLLDHVIISRKRCWELGRGCVKNVLVFFNHLVKFEIGQKSYPVFLYVGRHCI